jgi:hypothetical protein
MKRIIYKIFLLIVLSIPWFNAFPQQTIEYGIRGGLNISKIHGEYGVDSEPLTSITISIFISKPINEYFAFQPEITFISKGAKFDYTPYFIVTEKDILTYLEFPILAKAIFPIIDKIKIFILGGPAPSLLLRTKYKLKGVDANYIAYLLDIPTEGTFEDIGLDTKPFELNLTFGAGISYSLKNNSILLDFRYSLGLTNIFDLEPIVDAKNGVFSITSGVAF